MMTLERNGTSREGFTLIEVLMAAFIIALGVLGLSALFAGAARQQQVASQTTNAVVVSSNVQAVISRNLGRLDGSSLSDVLDEEGVWLPIPTPNDENYLSIDAADDGDVDGSLYFLVDETQPATLVELPQNDSYDDYFRFDWPTAAAPPAMPSPRGVMRELPHGRIDPASISLIRVCLGSTQASEADECSREYRFRYVTGSAVAAAIPTLPPEPETAAAVSAWGVLDESTAIFFPDGIINNRNYIILDLGVGNMSEDALKNPYPARITSFLMLDINEPTLGDDLQLRRIEMEQYAWRNDRLISLPDRVTTKEDIGSVTGQRPDVSFALLYRTFASGASQVGIFTYQISPVDGRALRPTQTVRQGESLYAPGERLQDIVAGGSGPGIAPLARVENVDLAYDNLNKVYYITVTDNPDTRWAAEPGQLLVIAERENASSVTGRRTGSDLPVRVLRKTKLANGRIRADIDRAPRAEGESFLETINSTEEVAVWAVQETVKNPRGGSTWKLSPLDFRVVQVR